MSQFRRFGRSFPMPSTLQVSHELRALCADESARERCAEEDGLPAESSWETIVERRQTLAQKWN